MAIMAAQMRVGYVPSSDYYSRRVTPRGPGRNGCCTIAGTGGQLLRVLSVSSRNIDNIVTATFCRYVNITRRVARATTRRHRSRRGVGT